MRSQHLHTRAVCHGQCLLISRVVWGILFARHLQLQGPLANTCVVYVGETSGSCWGPGKYSYWQPLGVNL